MGPKSKLVCTLPCGRAVAALLLGAVLIFLIFVVRGDFSNFRAFLSRCPVFSTLIAQRERTLAQANLTNLNYYLPSFEDLVDFIQHGGVFKKNRLRGYNGYIDYYSQVVNLFPAMAEAHAMMGFLYFQENNLTGARAEYQKAAALAPSFFWHHYNLGLLYIKTKDYPLAQTELRKALRASPADTFKSIFNSKVYQQILAQKDFHVDLPARFRLAYRNAEDLLKMCVFFSGTNRQIPDDQFAEKLDLKIF